MSEVRYRVLQPDQHTPEEDHEHLGDGEYIAPTSDGIDMLEETGVIEVLEWDYSEGSVEFSPDAPLEPVTREDHDGEGDIGVIHVHEDTTRPGRPTVPQTLELGTWECQRCGALTGPEENPHHDTGPGLEAPPECSACERSGPFAHAGGLSDSDLQMVTRGPEMWHAPAGIDDSGYGDLWDDIRAFIRDHWDAGEGDHADAVYAGLTAFALSTWVRENLTFVPHLMLMGKTTGGKTRLLNTLARVSYRAVVSASATPASMFRLIDKYDVSYYISEYHGLDQDAQRELDNIVRAGQKRGEKVTRAEPTSTGHEPTVYDPFSHVAIATQYTPSDDIVNRCIQVRSSPADRDMPATLDEERARDLRDRLLYARYRLFDSDDWDAAEARAYGRLAEKNIAGRTREKLVGLLTIADLWDRVEEFEPFVASVREQDREAAADSEDALVVEAIRDAAHERVAEVTVLGGDPYSAVEIPYSSEGEMLGVVERYENMTGVEKGPSWLGHVVSRLDLETDRQRDGTVIKDANLGEKLRDLCEDLNLAWDPGANVAQEDAVRRVRSAIERQADADDGYARYEDVLEELNGDLGDRDPEHVIDSLRESGEVYEPHDGRLALV